MAIGFQNDEVRRAINIEPLGAEQRDGGALQWLAPESAKKAPAQKADAPAA
jgi:hypothetical protein